MNETSRHQQELIAARDRAFAWGYRSALEDAHDAICSVVPPDERRAAISEINALLADAMGD